MPKVLVLYVRFIESMHGRLGKGMRFGIFVLIGILLIEGVSRFVFNSPTRWSIELAFFTFGTYFFFGGGYTMLRGEHIRMDALYSRLSVRGQAIVNLATFGLFVVYFVAFMWGGIEIASFSAEHGLRTRSMWRPPLAPIEIIILVAGGLLFLEVIARTIKDLAIVRRKPIE